MSLPDWLHRHLVAIGRDMKFNAEYRGIEDMYVFSMHMSVSVQIEELDRMFGIT